MADLRTSVIVDLAGNLPRQAQRYGQQFNKLGATGSRSMRLLSASVSATSRGLDRLGNRYTAFLGGAGFAGAVRNVINFDAVLKQLAVDADITDDQLQKVKNTILDIANSKNIRVDPGELTAGVKEIIARTGDLSVAMDNIENIGILMRATGAAGEDSAALIANFYEKFDIKTAKQMLATLDEAAMLGKAGAFELRDLATEGNAVSAAYAMTGRTGPIAAREMLTLLQIIRRTTPSAAEASTSFERLISTLTSEKVGMLQKNGIQIWDPEQLQAGVKIARPIPQILDDILKATKGDPELLAKIFDLRALRAVNAFALEFKSSGGLPSVERFMSVVGDGSQIIKDAGRNAGTAKAAIQSLKNSFGDFADENLSKPIQDLADWVNELDPEEVKAFFDAAITGAKVLAGVVVANKLLRFGKGIYDIAKGGKGGMSMGGFNGVQPVYVVNMGVGGMGGMGGIGGAAGRAGKGRWLMRAGMTAAMAGSMPVGQFARLGVGGAATTALGVSAAGAVGWGIGTIIHKQIEGGKVSDAIGDGINRVFAFFGNEDAKHLIEMRNRYQAQLEREQRISNLPAQARAATQNMTAGQINKIVNLMQDPLGKGGIAGTIKIEVEGPAKVKSMQGKGVDLEAQQRLGPVMGVAG